MGLSSYNAIDGLGQFINSLHIETYLQVNLINKNLNLQMNWLYHLILQKDESSWYPLFLPAHCPSLSSGKQHFDFPWGTLAQLCGSGGVDHTSPLPGGHMARPSQLEHSGLWSLWKGQSRAVSLSILPSSLPRSFFSPLVLPSFLPSQCPTMCLCQKSLLLGSLLAPQKYESCKA